MVVDRIVVGPDIAPRLAESFETALKLADGIAFAEFADEMAEDGGAKRLIFSEKFADPISGFTIPEIEPRLFSFNNPFGACPVCDGLGSEQKIDPDLIVPDVTLSLRDGAISPWSKTSAPYYLQTLNAVAKHFGASTGTAWEDLPKEVQDAVLYGTGKTPINFVYDDGLSDLQDQEALRRRDRQSRTALQGDRERRHARGDRALHVVGALPRLQRLPAEARGAGGQDRRPPHRPGHGQVDPRRRRLVRATCRSV